MRRRLSRLVQSTVAYIESHQHHVWMLLLSLYLLSRFSHFGRDLTNEEGVFYRPGREFWLGQGFNLDMGVSTHLPDMRTNPFHKPPLTSLLLGAASFLGPQPIEAARLVPVLIGLWLVWYSYKLTQSLLAPVLLVFSPFFFSASSHMQTDPTVGLLGYSLVLGAIHQWIETQGKSKGLLSLAGFAVLFLGKIEIAVIAGTVVFLVSLFPSFPQRLRWYRQMATATVIGVSAFVLVTYLLGAQLGLGMRDSVGAVVGTILRITGDLAQDQIQSGSGSGAGRRAYITATLDGVFFGWFWVFAWMPLIGAVVHKFIKQKYQDPLKAIKAALSSFGLFEASLAVAALVPYIVYMRGGYTGDGFPRYFLIVALPLVVLAAVAGGKLVSQTKTLATALTLLCVAVFWVPPTVSLWQSPGSVSVGKGFKGKRLAAAVLGALTRPGDLVLASEYVQPYLNARRWLVYESFEPYPVEHEQALRLAKELRGAMMGLPAKGEPNRYDGIKGKIALSMEKRGAKSLTYDGEEILYFEN